MEKDIKEKRLLELEDLRRIAFVSAFSVSPDGGKVVFSRYTSDFDSGDFFSHLYEVPAGGGGVKPIAFAEGCSQFCPAYSPDGKRLAFLSTRSGERQIWLLDGENGGEPRLLTTLRHGVNAFAWSPDGTRLAFEAPLWPDETPEQAQREMTPAEREEMAWKRENLPVVVETLMYKFDETFGVADGSYRQIGVIPASGGPATLLARGRMHCEAPAWSPDGSTLAFYGYPYGHHKASRKEIFLTPAAGGEVQQLTKDSTFLGGPLVFSADGRSIFHCGMVEAESDGFLVRLFRYSLDENTDTSIFPTEEVCHGVDLLSVGKSVYGETNPAVQLDAAGKTVYFISGWKGFTHVYRMNLEDEPKIEQVTQGEISVRTFCAPLNGRLFLTRGAHLLPDDLFCLDLKSGNETRLTFSNDWLDSIALRQPQEMWVESADRTCKIHGWVIPPVVLEEGKKYPAVLDIHGGPEAMYTAGFFFEGHMLSASGMAAVYCDPRGSTGYGREFGKGEYANGPQAYDDLMSFLDAAIAKFDWLDGERVGVTGGSYGGEMTNRIIGTTRRFKAAVTQRTFCNPATSYGTGDMGFVSSLPQKPKSFAEYMFARARRGELTLIDRMKTPLLILHGERDYRCTLEQGEQLFIAMKERNPEVPVRMVVYPGENHNLTRTGKMHFQISHLSEMVAWFRQYLGEKEESRHE